jgi:hypothetical protein
MACARGSDFTMSRPGLGSALGLLTYCSKAKGKWKLGQAEPRSLSRGLLYKGHTVGRISRIQMYLSKQENTSRNAVRREAGDQICSTITAQRFAHNEHTVAML